MNRIKIFNLKNKFIKLNKFICIQIFDKHDCSLRYSKCNYIYVCIFYFILSFTNYITTNANTWIIIINSTVQVVLICNLYMNILEVFTK